MERRKVDVLCVQETRWKGEKARVIGGGCKIWYRGDDGQRNGVGVVVRGDLVDNVVEVERISDRLMTMKLEVNGILINIVCAYAPQVGCDEKEKEAFWADMYETVEKIPRCERLVIGADLNAHVGEGNTNDKEVMGKHGFGRRNAEGQMVVDFAKRWELMVSNTMFVKRSQQKVTYSSGGKSTQVDYVLVRRERMRNVWDTEVIVGESVAKQHRMVVSRLVMWAKWRRAEKREPRTK
ncbi:craniofacial development protein 2-like [Penaeus indicus]|uniref:craniofacial development protein 2-like n=1 Tax=Penaeus indicus TaxID=29960 RepID=UPI00300C26E9